MKNTSNVLVLAISTVLFTAASTTEAQSATVSFFTDFSSFDQATNTTLVEDFESVAPKDTLLPSFQSNGNTYTGFAGSPFPNVAVSSPGYTNYGVPVTTSSILAANGDEDFTVNFGTPTQALGFDTYLNAFGPATISVFGSSGLLDTFTLSHDPTEIGFLGLVADEVVTSIRWTTVNGAVTNTGIDNIIQGSPRQTQTAPEPASVLSLLALGTLGAVSTLKGNRKVS